jgi:pSer/pThr/pTyr-binding forkhead associated (FHA) protein
MLKIRDKNTSRSIWLVGPEMTIGSAADNDLVVKGEGVAPHHARFSIVDDNINIFSISGTKVKVNSLDISGSAELALNDEVKIGARVFQIIDPKQEVNKSQPLPSVNPVTAPAVVEGSGWFIQADASLKNRQYPINGEVTLGRSPECDLTFTHDQLSRKHVMFKVFKGALYVKDLGSSNGTLVNGSKADQIKLHHGDLVSFGQLSFSVIAPSSSTDSAAVSDGSDLNKTVVQSAVSAELIQAAVEKAASVSKPEPQSSDKAEEEQTSNTSSINMVRVALVVTLVLAMGLAAVLGLR